MATTVMTKERIENLAKMLDDRMTKELLGHQSDALAYAMAAHPRFIVDPGKADGGHSHQMTAQEAPNHTHGYSKHPSTVHPARWSDGNLYHMLAARLGWGTTDGECPFKNVICTRVTDERVAIFLQTKDDALLIDDGAYLFPSDALVTQLRILLG